MLLHFSPPSLSLSRLVLGNELKSRSPDSSTIIIITMRRSISLGVSPQMILKPISKVINNRRNNAKNYCYYTRSKISLCACCFFPRFVSILRQRAAAASKRQSSIILFIQLLMPTKIGKTHSSTARVASRRLLIPFITDVLMALRVSRSVICSIYF